MDQLNESIKKKNLWFCCLIVWEFLLLFKSCTRSRQEYSCFWTCEDLPAYISWSTSTVSALGLVAGALMTF